MSKHHVTYDDDGLAKNDPWSLDEYLQEDNFGQGDVDLVKESVLSWLQEYADADCDLHDVIRELDPK